MSKKFIFAWVFFVVGLLLCFLYIGSKMNHIYKDYFSLENNLSEAASIYMSTNPFDLDEGDSMKINIEDLEGTFIDSISVGDDKCTGYVLVSKNSGKLSYETYIECDNYKTPKN